MWIPEVGEKIELVTKLFLALPLCAHPRIQETRQTVTEECCAYLVKIKAIYHHNFFISFLKDPYKSIIYGYPLVHNQSSD